MEIIAQEVEGPTGISHNEEGKSTLIVLLILGFILLVYSILRPVFRCIRYFKKQNSEWVQLKDQEFSMETVAYNGLLEELATGESVLYANADDTDIFFIGTTALGFLCGLILFILPIHDLATSYDPTVFYICLIFGLLGYICVFGYELSAIRTSYNVTAITNRRALYMKVTASGRFNSASRKLFKTAPLQNLVLSNFESRPVNETATIGRLVYNDRPSKYNYDLTMVMNPEKVKLLVEQHQTTSSV